MDEAPKGSGTSATSSRIEEVVGVIEGLSWRNGFNVDSEGHLEEIVRWIRQKVQQLGSPEG